jgi:hypothetical protein
MRGVITSNADITVTRSFSLNDLFTSKDNVEVITLVMFSSLSVSLSDTKSSSLQESLRRGQLSAGLLRTR